MITTADALRIQMFITGWHTRTAPRADDPDAAKFIAKVWADALNARDLVLADCLTGIENRAIANPTAWAPELAEVITSALAVRSKRTNDALDARAIADGPAEPDPYTPETLAHGCPECNAPASIRCLIDTPNGRQIPQRRPCRSRVELIHAEPDSTPPPSVPSSDGPVAPGSVERGEFGGPAPQRLNGAVQ